MKQLLLKKDNYYMLLVLFFSTSSFLFSQENDQEIRSFPVGLRIGVHYDFFSNTNENASIGLNYSNRLTLIGGFDIEVMRRKRWLLTTGFYIKNISLKRNYNIRSTQLGENFAIEESFWQSPYWTYHLPIEILIKMKSPMRSPLYLKAGLELQYYGYTSGRYQSNYLRLRNNPLLIGDYQDYPSPITFGLNLGFAKDLYLKDRSKFRFAASGHYHFQYIYVTKITSTNLTIPEATSTHRWTGHYLNFSLTYFPKSGFLKF
ncbi:hypothetical protein I5168_05105 [Nonlabens sp. SCSIO 43208]|uniref:hypothetical protein n=1 Tax=Nonlabens sp. SCSIO 43208 TaxID=2793009 RepID=UPI003D6A49C2